PSITKSIFKGRHIKPLQTTSTKTANNNNPNPNHILPAKIKDPEDEDTGILNCTRNEKFNEDDFMCGVRDGFGSELQ
ncbi:hypothetical protein M8C21_030998, partial [Ambrosia artemisiifolia]